MIARWLVLTVVLLMLGPAGTTTLYARQKSGKSQAVHSSGQRRRLRALGYLAGGAGLFVGGSMLLRSADQYRKGDPACIYFLGCFPTTIHTRSTGRLAGGATMMGSGSVLFVLGLRDWDR